MIISPCDDRMFEVQDGKKERRKISHVRTQCVVLKIVHLDLICRLLLGEGDNAILHLVNGID